LPQIDNVQKQELQPTRQAWHVHYLLDALKVHLQHLRSSFFLLHRGSHGAQQLDQRLNGRLVGETLKVKKLQNTLVHDPQRQHLKFVELTNELDETETLALGRRSDVILIGKHDFRLAFGLLGKIDLPTTFKLFLASVE